MVEDVQKKLIRIASLDDPRVEDYRALREKDLAVRRRSFIAESEVVLRVLLSRGRYPVRSIFVADARVDKIADALATVPRDVPIYTAEQRVLDEVVGFHIHRGVLAAGERTPLPTPEALLAAEGNEPRRIVVLESLTNHDNVGGVFRNAAAFGACGVLIDRATCDPLYRKAIRVSVGGSLVVPFARADRSMDLLAAARAAGFQLAALSPRRDAVPLSELASVPGRVALMLGSEGPGLTDASMRAADVLVRVDMDADFDSLNVATTSGIALHAIRRAQG